MNLIYINNLNDLMEDLSKYREMFPESYTRYSEIKETLFYRQNDPMGSTFGISVAKQWADRCYGFELERKPGGAEVLIWVGWLRWDCSGEWAFTTISVRKAKRRSRNTKKQKE